MGDITDQATKVRTGEELDAAKILDFLKDKIPGLGNELEISQFPSGFSNLTYCLRSGNKEFVLRRPPFGKKAKSAHDMGREYKMLSALKPVFPYCPTPLVYSDDESIIGCPFYVMERIEGIILRKNIPAGLNFSASDAHNLCEELLDVQIKLHFIDYQAIGLSSLGKPEDYVERQVEGWSARYRDARTPDAPDYERVMAWLKDKKPAATVKSTIIHNDYKFDNVVLDPADPLKIIGVLDWEMATIGDPLMDLGNSLAYWVDRDDPENMQLIRLMPTNIEGALTRKELISLYAERTGLPIANFDFYYCFGLFRLAVIAQQIYYRFYHGQTKDQRFQMLIFAVKALEEAATKLIDQSKL
jgi:aminoglycoside phosphotransferase (APT) family kinase protein